MTLRLDMSVGPVQGFVAQSRRTRDLWGSSYLLSFLSAHAMHGAQQAGGRIVRPVVDSDPLFLWVAGSREGDAPRIGSVPNHFVIELEGDPSSIAHASVEALEAAWQRVCEAVWRRFVEHARDAGESTREIWARQVNDFWEVTWTAGESTVSAGLLGRRKHWRTHRLPDEPGDKCTVMHDLQELSGFVRAESRSSRENQDKFWRRVRERTGPLDLREDERLCAVALVKRLFPKVASEALGWSVDISHWPSTVYVGAVPWIGRATAVAPEIARRYAEQVRQVAPPGVLAEQRPSFASLDHTVGGDFQRLDANWFHLGFVEDERLCPLADSAPPNARDGLIHLLRELQSAEDEGGRAVGPAPSFFALLLADGDRLGKLVGNLGGARVGRALATFTATVPGIVREHDGVTVYAGGDDVLAMLPVSRALACASALSGCYGEAFADGDAEATLSAAIVFAHVRLPLGAVISEAHRLLDDVAKDANGRDSLAAGVLKRGGMHCEWVTTWTRRASGGGSARATDLLHDLAAHLDEGAAEPGLSSGLLYRTRETLSLLCGWPQWVPGAWGALPPELDLRAFLHAEVLRSLADRSEANGIDADELTDLLVSLLGPSRSLADSGSSITAEAGVDALLVARFLSAPAHEEDRE